MEKPGLALLITKAMKNKAGESDEHEDEAHDQLKEISRDLLDAIKADDEEAVASLLKEAFDCLEMVPHEEYSDEE